MREVVTETITNLACVFELFQISKNNICISGKGGKSTCNVNTKSGEEILALMLTNLGAESLKNIKTPCVVLIYFFNDPFGYFVTVRPKSKQMHC